MEARPTRLNSLARTGPFTLLQRFLIDDIANVFDQPGTRKASQPAGNGNDNDLMTWTPKVDVKQRGNDLVISADLPGVRPDDVAVEVPDLKQQIAICVYRPRVKLRSKLPAPAFRRRLR